jgi:hypothetical protein
MYLRRLVKWLRDTSIELPVLRSGVCWGWLELELGGSGENATIYRIYMVFLSHRSIMWLMVYFSGLVVGLHSLTETRQKQGHLYVARDIVGLLTLRLKHARVHYRQMPGGLVVSDR